MTSLEIDSHYHCSMYSGADFDLGQEFYEADGIRRLDSNNRMARMVMGDGGTFHGLQY
jgi:hypothetical protein